MSTTTRLQKEPSDNNLLKPPTITTNNSNSPTTSTTGSSKLGFLNRSKSNSNFNLGELKSKIEQHQGTSSTNNTGIATTTASTTTTTTSHSITLSSSSSSSSLTSISPSTSSTNLSSSGSQSHQSHHQKTNSNTGNSNFNSIKASFNQFTSSLSHSSNKDNNSTPLKSPRTSTNNITMVNNNHHSSSPSPQSPMSKSGGIGGGKVASILAANGATLANSLNNLHGHINNTSNGNLSSSFGSVSQQQNISISSSALNYNYQQPNNGLSVDNDNNSSGGGSNGMIGDAAHSSGYQSSLSSSTMDASPKSMTETIEIMVVGDELSNKARFISSFLNNGIGEDPTLETTTTKKSITIQSGAYNVNINTTVGQEEFWGINDVYYRSSQGFVFVYNVNSRESFLSFLKFRDKIIHEKGTENILMAMVGLTSPLINESGEESSIREVTSTEAKRMADLYSCSFVELNSFGLDCEHQIQSIVTDLLGRITNYQSNVVANGGNDSSQQTIEILMLGDIFVGKTQIIQRLLGNPYQCQYKETTEWNKNIYQITVNDTRYLLKIVDTCGLDIEETLNRERLVSSQGFVFVYSIASRESFYMIEALRKKLALIKGDTKVPAVLIANKGDSLIRQVTFDEGSKMAQHLNSQFFEISSMLADDDSIVKPFEQLVQDIQKSTNSSVEMGEIKKKGYLFKEGKKLKSMSKYYFKVSKCSLSYCKNEQSKSKVKHIPLSENIQLAIPHIGAEKKDSWPFQVITDPISKSSLNLIATSEEERNSWIKAIRFNCYLEEVTCNIMEEVTNNIIYEIASQSIGSTGSGGGGSGTPNSHLKRQDTSQQLLSPFGKLGVSSGSTPTSPHSSNNNFHNLSSTSNSSSSFLSSSMNSNFSYSSSISSFSSDSMSSSPPGNDHQTSFPPSPQFKKNILFGRTNSSSKIKK